MDTSMEQTISQIITRTRAIEAAMHDQNTVWSIHPMGFDGEPSPANLEVGRDFVKWVIVDPWVAPCDGEVEFYGLYADGDLVLVDRVPNAPLNLQEGDSLSLTWTLRVVRLARR